MGQPYSDEDRPGDFNAPRQYGSGGPMDFNTMGSPPQHPGELPPGGSGVQSSTWPNVVGVIAIVFGVLGILGGIMNIASVLLMGAFQEITNKTGDVEASVVFEAQAEYKGLVVLSGVLSIGVAALLLVGGIGLIKRRGWGVRISLLWVVVKVVLVAFNSILSYKVGVAQMERMGEMTDVQGALPGIDMETLQLFGTVLGLLWGWALPVFMLIWLNRGKIREETRQWN